MTHLFETPEAAEELNSLCSFCGRTKFKIGNFGGGWQLYRCIEDGCLDHCTWNHTSTHIFQPLGDHSDTMSIIRGS